MAQKKPASKKSRAGATAKKTARKRPAAKKAARKRGAAKKAGSGSSRIRETARPRRVENGRLYFMDVTKRNKAASILHRKGIRDVEKWEDLNTPKGKPSFILTSHAASTAEMQYVLMHANPELAPADQGSAAEAAAAAAAMYEKFHGKPSTTTKIVTVEEDVPAEVADCGKLLQLDVFIDGDRMASELKAKGNVRVWTTPEGGQIYFGLGDQSIDIEAIGMGYLLPKDHITIGPVKMIHYLSAKDFHNFEPVHYYHRFGEQDGKMPWLNYDVRSRRMYLTGGTYQVRREGIVR